MAILFESHFLNILYENDYLTPQKCLLQITPADMD